MHSITACHLPRPVWFINIFRSDEGWDEAICYVLCACLGNLILRYEEYCVGASVAPWHALGQPANFIPVAPVLGFAIRCLYSSNLPLSPITAFAISQNPIIGSLLMDICCGVILNVVLVGVVAKLSKPTSSDAMKVGWDTSTHNSMASCMMLQV
jgi:hypothetical protein